MKKRMHSCTQDRFCLQDSVCLPSTGVGTSYALCVCHGSASYSTCYFHKRRVSPVRTPACPPGSWVSAHAQGFCCTPEADEVMYLLWMIMFLKSCFMFLLDCWRISEFIWCCKFIKMITITPMSVCLQLPSTTHTSHGTPLALENK